MAGSLATMILRAPHPPTTMKMLLSGDASNATPANARIFSLEVDGVDIMIGDGSEQNLGRGHHHHLAGVASSGGAYPYTLNRNFLLLSRC